METLYSFIYIALQLTILFIGVSFLINLLQVFVPYDKLERLLRESNSVKSGIIALGFAFITPFCSCSTIPLVVNLLKNNVRFGIVMVFLFASPILDPTILTIMTVIMGWEVALIYIVVTASLSLLIGIGLEYLGYEKYIKDHLIQGRAYRDKTFSWKIAWKETWTMFKTISPYLVAGAAIGAIIHGLVPSEFIAQHFGGEAWWLIPIAAVIGIPLYIRLSSMIPMSQILILNGMAVGPVMAMMISSAGASLPELVLLKSIFQKQLIIAFVVSVLTMSTFSGFIFYFI